MFGDILSWFLQTLPVSASWIVVVLVVSVIYRLTVSRFDASGQRAEPDRQQIEYQRRRRL